MKKLQLPALLVVVTCAIIGITQLRKPETSTVGDAPAVSGTTGKFLFISDVHLDPQLTVTNSYGHQDAGMDVWSAFTWKLDQVMQSPDAPSFIIYTGDLPVHVSYACSPLGSAETNAHDTAMAMVLNELRDLSVKYGVRTFYLPGNNDALNGDYLPFADAAGYTTLSLVDSASGLFPTDSTAAAMISYQPGKGYYSAYAMRGLRIIALNTVVYNTSCSPYPGQEKACSDEMLWLRQQLSDAEQKNEQCYIAMHIPPGGDYHGNPMWNTNGGNWADTFLALAAQYRASISGVLYGHTHEDEMRLLYAPGTDTVAEVAVSCPGISILHKNNPGFKVVTFDVRSKELLDFTTLYTDIPVSPKNWPGSYSFSSVFKSAPGETIFHRVTTMDQQSLISGIGYTYNVRHGSASPTTVMNFYQVKAQ
ncbi:MAG: metallophosphoesterase [Taibaiella sp.]|nr:metallophosphoesterase [Taibaiella sp.]